MLRFVITLLLISTSLFSSIAVTENEPSSLVAGVVSAVTGDLYAYEEDIIIQGAEPLKLKRSYISAKGRGTWNFFDHLTALHINLFQFIVSEPNGTQLKYQYDRQEILFKKKKTKEICHHFKPIDLREEAKGLTNTARSVISAHTNLKNQKLHLSGDEEHFEVICPDGTKRKYRRKNTQKTSFTIKTGVGKIKVREPFQSYSLYSEELPNGNKILYNWGSNDQLLSIRTTDPSETKTYAEAVAHYHGEIKKDREGNEYLTTQNFDIHTSDGRILEYRFFSDGEHIPNVIEKLDFRPSQSPGVGRSQLARISNTGDVAIAPTAESFASVQNQVFNHVGYKAHRKWYLHNIITSDSPNEAISYTEPEENKLRKVHSIKLANTQDLKIEYTNDNTVKKLLAPIGDDQTPQPIYTFELNPSDRFTKVLNAENSLTEYHYDTEQRLTSIDYLDERNNLHHKTKYIWCDDGTIDATNLRCKLLLDQNKNPIHATVYHYDSRGNIAAETFHGNLSGTGEPFALDDKSLPENPAKETYTKKYQYTEDGRNLLIAQEEDNGRKFTYNYLPNTNLLAAKYTYDGEEIKERFFYEYNSDNILIKEIHDDGDNLSRENLFSVTTRLIKEIIPKKTAPYQNMPETIAEKYWDGRSEQLLKKIELTYTTGGKISEKKIYDSNNTYCYSIKYQYDEKGNLIRETNPLGQTAESSYDELGNKLTFRNFGSQITTHMSYDYSNRLIESREENRTHSYTYDKTHNKTSSTDYHGYTTYYEYDPFGHQTAQIQPLIDGEQPKNIYQYDAAGNLISETDPLGHIKTYSYNAYQVPPLFSRQQKKPSFIHSTTHVFKEECKLLEE